MAYYPILMDLEGRRALVVGGGAVAERKVLGLLDSGAKVELVARDINPRLMDMASKGLIRWAAEEFAEEQLQGAALVIAATDSEAVNRQVSSAAQSRGIPVNAVDQPADCTFIVPAVVRRGDFLIAVSTSGCSPALARRVREELERCFGSEYDEFLRLMRKIRPLVLKRGEGQEENSRVFKELLDSGLLEAVRFKDWKKAGEILTGALGSRWQACSRIRARGYKKPHGLGSLL
jgi:precorrin-2 dehydrogenase/sirohydrochlorin ferrochelatase